MRTLCPPKPRSFVTKPDLVRLGLDHLLGTPMLRAYMHGFFVDNRLYNKAKWVPPASILPFG